MANKTIGQLNYLQQTIDEDDKLILFRPTDASIATTQSGATYRVRVGDLPFGSGGGLNNIQDTENGGIQLSNGLSTASGNYAFALSTGAYAPGNNSFALGNSTASGSNSLAIGSETHANGNFSFTCGSRTKASSSSVAEGEASEAGGAYSHAEGHQTHTYASWSHAQGIGSETRAMGSHAEGASKVGTNSYVGHAEGFQTTASSTASHSEGRNTLASGDAAHVEGSISTAAGSYSHAEGQGTIASTIGAHAEGYGTTAAGAYSHTEGRNNIASANQGHVGGYGSTAQGVNNFVHGSYLVSTKDNQAVFGQYNVSTNSLFVVGNGSAADRSNAFMVHSDGRVSAGAGAQNNEDLLRKDDVTYGNLAPSAITVSNNTYTTLMEHTFQANTCYIIYYNAGWSSSSTVGQRMLLISTNSEATGNIDRYSKVVAEGQGVNNSPLCGIKLLKTDTSDTTYYIRFRQTSGSTMSVIPGLAWIKLN